MFRKRHRSSRTVLPQYSMVVSSDAALKSALETAVGGERIFLTNGTYAQLHMFVPNSASAYVQVVGESRDGVVISGTNLSAQSYYRFTNITFDSLFSASLCGHIWIDQCSVKGITTVDTHDIIIDRNDVNSANYNMQIRDLTRVTENVTITSNTIHNANIDCIQIACGDGAHSGTIKNLVFSNNLVYGAARTAKYHGDGHQWWVYRKQFGEAGVKNWQVLDNVYVLANPAQCLFIGFEAVRSATFAKDEPAVLIQFSSPEGRFSDFSATVDISSYLKSQSNYRARFTGASGTFTGVETGDWLTVSGASTSLGNNDDYLVAEIDSIDAAWVNGVPRSSMYDTGVIAGNFIIGNGPYAAMASGCVDTIFDENMVLGVTNASSPMNIFVRNHCKALVKENNISNTEYPPSVEMPTEGIIETPLLTIARNDLSLPRHQELCFVNPRTHASRFLPVDWYPTPYLDALAPGHRAIAAIKALVAPPPFYLRLPDDFYAPAAPLHVDLTAANITTGAALAGETCVWDWGDGSATEAGVSVGHDFDIQGDYKVEATIGTDTVERQVVVKSRFPTYLPLLSEGLANHGWAHDTWSEVGTISYPNPELTAGTNYIEGLLETFKLAVPTFTASIKFKVSAGQSGAPIYIQNVLMVRVVVPNGLSLTVGTNSVTVAGLRLDQAPYLDTYNRITVVADNGTASAYLNDATTPFTTFACPSLVGPQTFTTRLGNYFGWTGNISDLVIVPDVLDCSVGAETAVLAAIAANEMVYDIPVAEDFSVTWAPDADGVMRIDVAPHVTVDASGDTPLDVDYIRIVSGTITPDWEAKIEPLTGYVGITSTGGALPASVDYEIYTNPGFLYARGTITWTA